MKKPEFWSNEHLAAQCIFPRLEVSRYYNDLTYNAEIVGLAQKGIGGFCLFAGTADEVQKITQELQIYSDIPLIFSGDFEFGLPMRFDGGSEFPHAMALGVADDENITFDIALAIATELKDCGIDWNLAPVCDINSNPDNPIINIRSFGSDEEIVSNHSLKFIEGTQSRKVLACAKHFPGHGDTSADSHLELPELKKNRQELSELEMKPYINAIQGGVKSVMIAHIALPELDESLLPASLSEKIITGFLRQELGFDGLIITDALDMKAITKTFESGSETVLAINAGANIALLPPEPDKAISSLVLKAEQDRGFREKLIFSCKKLLDAKKWAGLIPEKRSGDSGKLLYYPNHEKKALIAALKAIRISGDSDLIPIDENSALTGFAVIQNENLNKGARFFNLISQSIPNDCDFGFIDASISEEEIDNLRSSTAVSELFILAFFFKSIAYKGTAGISEDFKKKINTLTAGKKVIAVYLGNPYIKSGIHTDTEIFAYSDSEPSIAASVIKLSGKEIDFNSW